MKLEPCPSCGGSVHVDYCLGEYFISCENNCMDIPACFHTSEPYTIEDWNKRMRTGKREMNLYIDEFHQRMGGLK